jgi:DNA helicase-2/ATP-dependent DNA helicase PcrA
LEGLNNEQRLAVETVAGPVLILAGAGSGKTKALTHRYAYLQRSGVSSANILCVTFTNKAAGEMRERVARLLGYDDHGIGAGPTFPWLGTFHRICVRLLRRELAQQTFNKRTDRFVIYDESDTAVAVKRAMADLKLDSKTWNPNTIRNHISGAKNELLRPAQYARYATGPWQQNILAVYQRYEEIMAEANAFDFDDLVLACVEFLQQNPERLAWYQEQFKYVMVDEYQDTNRPQYKLITLLAAGSRNLFVIGDDWQSIYSWRGADFRTILNFSVDYPDATVIKLEQNYRSTQTILDAAQAVILRNTERSDKQLWTDGAKGAPVTVVECINERDEADFIMREVRALARLGKYQAQDCVVLYRTNAQSRAVEESFVKAGQAYRIVGGVRFWDRKEVRDAMAYLKYLENPRDLVSLERVINVPARGIGQKTVSQVLQAFADNPGVGLGGLPAKTHGFFQQMEGFRSSLPAMRPAELLRNILEKTGYLLALQDGSIEGEARYDNVLELLSAADRFDTVTDFLEEATLVQDGDALAVDMAGGFVTLMSLHAAKGLEFPVVFLVGMEEGVFPHSRSLEDAGELEEERRLAYVGMTRARERLYLLYAGERRVHGLLQSSPPSRFIAEIPHDLIEQI